MYFTNLNIFHKLKEDYGGEKLTMFSLHLMSSCLKFKNVKIKIYTNFICFFSWMMDVVYHLDRRIQTKGV